MFDIEELMYRCNDIALNGSGFVSPNPLVGAVIVRSNGEIISEGWHKEFGGVHAEVDAIMNAKRSGTKDFTDTTLIVNLEPCTHFGKQPPCVDAILSAGIPRVVVGMLDPNPIVSGKGVAMLRDNGVEVEVGICADDCRAVNRYYCYYIAAGMPYTILKVAQTLDGCIATKNGESKYISCEESRRRVHCLRREVDAIMVGVNTVLADDPLLDTRMIMDDEELRHRNPRIIIMDTNLRIPANANVITSHKDRKVIVVHSDELQESGDIVEIKSRMEQLKDAGVLLLEAPMKSGKLHLRKVVSRLTLEYCFTSMLVEGGAEVFGSFINSNLANEIHIFTSPIIMGDGKHAFANVQTENMDLAKRYKFVGNFDSGTDVHSVLTKIE
ncbi:MAG: bifunctional diaminohydroxyphosphoribosylaminopyrimidine deaminase/5-amino-6-(5-phosphoribosylamino)uracil reductase RibD [Ignavibacteria bacterium]|jgi:diaminohydroxyphosphoribosylaminopyrimidine deaminase/5-amino-6-(5-phosphoribosylamino)uracil reductase|nr:bifunctional diaminohydroxyphosphoribosylaminopyrimidine deaminase/5-amino-6-(5-phosphoribosylamino)uracil reductase RibD [Ignavibacteria bacterium]